MVGIGIEIVVVVGIEVVVGFGIEVVGGFGAEVVVVVRCRYNINKSRLGNLR